MFVRLWLSRAAVKAQLCWKWTQHDYKNMKINISSWARGKTLQRNAYNAFFKTSEIWIKWVVTVYFLTMQLDQMLCSVSLKYCGVVRKEKCPPWCPSALGVVIKRILFSIQQKSKSVQFIKNVGQRQTADIKSRMLTGNILQCFPDKWLNGLIFCSLLIDWFLQLYWNATQIQEIVFVVFSNHIQKHISNFYKAVMCNKCIIHGLQNKCEHEWFVYVSALWWTVNLPGV